MHLVQSYPLPGWLMKAAAFGGAGVHVFILCSGFGFYLSYLNKPLKYKDFLRKRFGRIYWPMAIVCIATSLWMLYQGKDVLMPLLGNLLLFKMFVPELETSMGGQMWFISTIIQFYINWPLIEQILLSYKQIFIRMVLGAYIGVPGCEACSRGSCASNRRICHVPVPVLLRSMGIREIVESESSKKII